MADFPTPIIELGLSSNTGGYLVLNSATDGILDTNKLAAGTGQVPTWTDVTADLMAFTTDRGRQRQIDRFAAGRASITLDNSDGRFSPSNLSGPYVSGGVTQIRPGVAARIRATWAGITYDLWYGYVDSWTDSIDVHAPGVVTTTAACTDGLGRIARFDGTTEASQGAGELSGARIGRILDNCGWDAGLRDIDDGQTTLQATTLVDNALKELQAVADSENGEIYVSADGKLVFDQRYIRITDTRSNTSQATFGDGAGQRPYAGYSPAYDTDLIINRAQYTRIGGTTQVYDDVVSQADNGIVTETKDNLYNQTDTEVLAAAGWVVARFKDPEQRIDDITLVPIADPTNLWPQALGRQIRDRITFQRTPVAGDVIDQPHFIEGIKHGFDVSSSNWTTTFRLSSASAWQPFFILDSATQGKLNSGVLAY